MSMFRVTVFLQQADFGWSETWWNEGTAYGNIADKVNTMLEKRANLLSQRVSFGGVRFATDGVQRSSRLILPGERILDGQKVVVPASGFRADAPSIGAGEDRETYDQVRAALQIEVVAFGQRMGLRYMAGIPDQVSLTEPAVLDTGHPPKWWEAFKSWQSAMKAGAWRIRYTKKAGGTAVGPVARWVKQGAAPGLWGAVTLNTATIGANVGDKIIVRGVRMNAAGLRSPNGTQYVDSKVTDNAAGTTTFYLRNTQDLDIDRAVSLGDVRKQEFDYVVPTRLDPYSVGTHRRGGPFRRRRGKRSTPRYAN